MPAQLYHDLQATFLDALFCCAKMKEHCPSEPLYLVLAGTDPEERWFGNVRMAFKGGNYTSLDMVNSARSTAAIDRILSVDHPEWTANSRTQRRLQLDYSNPAVWDRENLSLEHVNIKAIWRSGYYKALGMLPAEDADDLDCTSTTLRSPIKKGIIVGVKNAPTEEEEEDWSIGDVGDEDEVDEVEVVVEPGVDNDELGEMIPDPDKSYDPFFLIDGKKVYKSTCLKSISSNTKLSKDRLRRVQGKSKYPGDKDASEDNNLFLFVGDLVLIMHPKDGPFVANVKSMKKANIPVHQIKITNDHTELKNNELALQRTVVCWKEGFIGKGLYLGR